MPAKFNLSTYLLAERSNSLRFVLLKITVCRFGLLEKSILSIVSLFSFVYEKYLSSTHFDKSIFVTLGQLSRVSYCNFVRAVKSKLSIILCCTETFVSAGVADKSNESIRLLLLESFLYVSSLRLLPITVRP